MHQASLRFKESSSTQPWSSGSSGRGWLVLRDWVKLGELMTFRSGFLDGEGCEGSADGYFANPCSRAGKQKEKVKDPFRGLLFEKFQVINDF